MFTVALFTVARMWKQPRWPSTDEWMRKLWYSGVWRYSGIQHSHKKEHIWVTSNEVDEPRAYYAELNKSEVQFSSSVVSNSLWPHGLQHTRLLCPSPTPGVYSNPCPLSQCCHPTISSSVVPFFSHLQSFPASGSFPMSQLFASGGQTIGSFSFNISPSNEHSGLISFRMDWFDLLAVQWTLKSLLQHYSSKTSVLQHSAFFTVQLSHPYMTTGKNIALTRWLLSINLFSMSASPLLPCK